METAFSAAHDTFRDELTSVARDGRRRWVYARRPAGPLYRARTIVSWFLLAFLFLAPFISVSGQPLMMLNVLERRFVLFGVLFRPQDFYLVVLIALTVLVTIVLATVVVGRVWCGWLCPQTVFMEMLFRRLEYWMEGSAEQQLRRDRAPWTRSKVLRKGAKHAVFFALSFVIANVFLAWVIGAPALKVIVTDPPSEHLVGLFSILIFSFVFYMVFVRFREQACVLACPYGRMLSALTDASTITVTYDWKRGEPRSRVIRNAARDARPRGDCIDCHQCVTVCPTGIDIRNGIQLECVACTACIDACNGVMRKVGRPTGLIRFASYDAVAAQDIDADAASGEPAAAVARRTGTTGVGDAAIAADRRTSRLNPRLPLSARAAAYSAVWLVLVATVVVLLVARRDLDVLILRQPGTLYTLVAGGDFANFYSVQALNRTPHATAFTIEVVEPRGATLTTLGAVGDVQPYGLAEGRLLLRLPPDRLQGASTPVRFAVRTESGVVQTIDSSFLGPATSWKVQ